MNATEFFATKEFGPIGDGTQPATIRVGYHFADELGEHEHSEKITDSECVRLANDQLCVWGCRSEIAERLVTRAVQSGKKVVWIADQNDFFEVERA